MVRNLPFHSSFLRFNPTLPPIRAPPSTQGNSWCQTWQGHSLCAEHPHGTARRDNVVFIIPSPRRYHHLRRGPHLLADRVSWDRKVRHRSFLGQFAWRPRRRFILLLIILEGHQRCQENYTHPCRAALAETQLAAIQRRPGKDFARPGRFLELDREEGEPGHPTSETLC